ncbi:MAG: MiaB/RimO family radical SAM methylthiotransferase, partial [Myxococcota bacterium]
LNTCTVTHRSDADVRKAVARLRREAPGAKVMITGCFAQRDPTAAAELEGVSAVVGNAHKSRLPVLAQEVLEGPRDGPIVVHTEMEAHPPGALPVEPVTTVLDRTRPFVKIQDGCDAHCTYCIIPDVRGPARGADPDKVLDAVRTLVERGYFEIVVAGIHLGTYAYTRDSGETLQLEGLVRNILEVPGLGRLRLSCIEPMAFPLGLIDLAAAEPRLAPHFHLPLQSGSDRILKRMVRPYRAVEYLALIQRIEAGVPGACLGTDVIVGFPGETEADFEDTVAFVEASPLHYVHVFSYSDRTAGSGRGTPSTRLGDKVDPRIIKERSTRLNAVGKAKWARYLDRQRGRTLPGLVLEPNPRDPSRVRVLTDNFCNVDCEAASLAQGQAVEVRVTGREGSRLVGAAASA